MVNRPNEGEQITVLIEVNGLPVTHVARAGKVRESSVIVPRRASEQSWPVEPQGEAVVLFTRKGRLFSWQMRVEEVLPTSYYLVSQSDPSEGDRREFVRASLPLLVRVGRTGRPLSGTWQPALVDLSSAGLRLASDLDVNDGEVLDVALRIDEPNSDIVARARVVRRLDGAHSAELACEFVELSSSDEERLEQAVFRRREAVLLDRIGPRDGAV